MCLPHGALLNRLGREHPPALHLGSPSCLYPLTPRHSPGGQGTLRYKGKLRERLATLTLINSAQHNGRATVQLK